MKYLVSIPNEATNYAVLETVKDIMLLVALFNGRFIDNKESEDKLRLELSEEIIRMSRQAGILIRFWGSGYSCTLYIVSSGKEVNVCFISEEKDNILLEPDYIISPVTTFEEDEELWQTKIGIKGKNMILHYTAWGKTKDNSRKKAEELARILTRKRKV